MPSSLEATDGSNGIVIHTYVSTIEFIALSLTI